MGNSSSQKPQEDDSSTNTPQLEKQHENHTQQKRDHDNQGIELEHDTKTTTTTVPYLGTPDPVGSKRSGSSSPLMSKTDPRLMSLLEFFRQLCERREDVFKQIIPVHRETFEEIFEKMEIMESRKKGKEEKKKLKMQRSNSFGDVESVRLRRFKVKPIDSGGATPPASGGSGGGKGGGGDKGGGGGGGINKPGGSK